MRKKLLKVKKMTKKELREEATACAVSILETLFLSPELCPEPIQGIVKDAEDFAFLVAESKKPKKLWSTLQKENAKKENAEAAQAPGTAARPVAKTEKQKKLDLLAKGQKKISQFFTTKAKAAVATVP